MKKNTLLPPAAIERETGLQLELVRKWRSRYGYPMPVTEDGITGYTRDQIAQLKSIARLIDAGFRASQVVGKPKEILQGYLSAVAASTCHDNWSEFTHRAVNLLRVHDLANLEDALQERMTALGMAEFACQIVAPLAVAIGEAWASGEIEVYQEHLCSSLLMQMLQAGIHRAERSRTGCVVLLATLSEEHHTLGVLMVQAILAQSGVNTVMLGASVPLPEITRAAENCKASVVALSFSFSFPARLIIPSLTDLRTHLDPRIGIWAGGAGISAVKDPKIPGLRFFDNLNLPVNDLAN